MEKLRFGVLGMLLVVVGCTESGGAANEIEGPDSVRVSIEDVEFQRLPDGDRVVSGTVINESTELISSAQIQLVLYDADNARVGTVLVPVQRIDPGGQQRFRTELDTDREIRSVRAHSVLLQ